MIRCLKCNKPIGPNASQLCRECRTSKCIKCGAVHVKKRNKFSDKCSTCARYKKGSHYKSWEKAIYAE